MIKLTSSPLLSIFKYSVLSFFISANTASALDTSLPTIGDYSSSIVSLNTEYNLGQGIIRQINASGQLLNDPIVESYLHDLTWDLVSSSQLEDKRIVLAVMDDKNINAFAAPGGVIGIHAGLVTGAHNEDELASVIAHELAHLSQRHFASKLENSRANTPFTIASLLGGILVAAANPEAGSAVIAGSIAKAQSSALAFSRKNEQEADRIGMLNLSKAKYDPYAMPRMFERLLNAQRLQGATPPEFLLTHPTSTARIADAKNRAATLNKGSKSKSSLDFAIVKARLKSKYSKNKQFSYNFFRDASLKNKTASNQYSFAISAAAVDKTKEALSALKKLPASWQKHLFVKLTQAEIHIQAQEYKLAYKILKKLNQIYPKHLTIQMLSAKMYIQAQQPDQAIETLRSALDNNSDNIQAWYLLAEAYGQVGDKNALHRARIEFFLLQGQTDKASQQINFARRERSIKEADIYQLDELELEVERVIAYMNTRY